ncbi:MAG: hypothetical protein Q8N22_03200 [bacterium]|nr:hypothetical protein [bacterium]
MRKILTIVGTMAGLLTARLTLAVCPVCTIAIAGGIGLSRWLGVDDAVSGVWVGGLIISGIILFLNWLDKKEIHFKFRRLVVAVLFYFVVVLPLYWAGIMGHPYNKFCGMDKLLLGIIGGSAAFLIGNWFSNFLKKKNQGKALFPFQKAVLPISFLIILSAIFFYLIKCRVIR